MPIHQTTLRLQIVLSLCRVPVSYTHLRIERTTEDIKRELTAIFRELKDPRVQQAFISIVRVEAVSYTHLKGIPMDYMLQNIEKAISVACKNYYGGNENVVFKVRKY